MKTSKNRVILGITSIIIFVLATVLMIVDWAVPLNLFTHPVLNFVAVLFLGFGIISLVLSLKKKLVWFLFLSAILIGFFALYILLNVLDAWWIALVIMVAIWAVFAIISVMVFGNITENISINKSPDYKTYHERKAEQKEETEEETLPEIKSFKD